MEQTLQDKMYALVEASLSSDISIKDFIAQHSITTARFYYWKNKYKENKLQNKVNGFIPIKPVLNTATVIEIFYPQGQKVVISGPHAIETVHALLGR